MTDTANPIAAMLDTLKEHGWTCRHPTKRHTLQGVDKVLRGCVAIEGKLFGVDREARLCEDGLVMLIGEMRDVDFATFLSWMGLSEEPKIEKPVPKGVRSLFGDDDE